MTNGFGLTIVALLLLSVIPIVSASSGAIWTTTDSCGDPQNANHYSVGEVVYINGKNFDSAQYKWDITGLPGGASCDPGIVVSGDFVNVDHSGKFCFPAYEVHPGDCGEYKATVEDTCNSELSIETDSNNNEGECDKIKKSDNYRVNEVPVVPEFGLLIGAITIMGALASFMIIRKK